MYSQQLKLQDYIEDVLRDINNSDIKVTADGSRVSMARAQINEIHKNDDGYVTVAVKDKGAWYQYHYKREELEENVDKLLSIKDINLYMSPNSFYKPSRRIENVRKLNSLFIDVDYYNIEKLRDLSPEQIIFLLDDEYFKIKVPDASLIVITGRGLAIYWLIEPVPYKVLPLWNAVQKFLLNELEEVGADPKSIDAARVMRLSGSINQKSKKPVELLIYNAEYKYSLREIQEEYMPSLTPYVENPCYKRRGRKPKIVKMFNVYSLHYARLCDIVTLQDVRGGLCRSEDGTLSETGQREIMCFLYRYYSCCFTQDTEKALQDTLEFNKGFVLPLDEKTVRSQTRQAEKAYEEWLLNDFNLKGRILTKEEMEKVKKKKEIYKFLGYNYTNKSLIALLVILEEEMRKLQTIISEKEVKRRNNNYNKDKFKKQRRNEKGLTKKQQELLDRLEVIKKLKEEGYKQTEIAQMLNISVRAVQRAYGKLNGK
ncbi:helix-turn-helix transcriptional regulator [Hathewaya limosa]|uniref:Replication protein n=1 Tax=Hathewaya limosa TaxID=1536 RepID=A0ABU0JYH1_HATLI|nr:helix-turn-helix domain-containing protein [Hathewaya limosa]MDQ0480942.1 hypothetical protein [Hathewaya limosa]